NKQIIFNISSIIALAVSIYNFFNFKEEIAIIREKVVKENEHFTSKNSNFKKTNGDLTTNDENLSITKELSESDQLKSIDEVNERIESFKRKTRAKKEYDKEDTI